MIKVAYDISHLGLSHYFPPSKGIARVVESLAYSLKDSKECELIFCTSGSSYSLQLTLDYLVSHPDLAKTFFPYKVWQFNQSLYQLNHQLRHIAELTPAPTNFLLKGLRRLLLYLNQTTDRIFTPFDQDFLTTVNIYHSPFEPIPTEIQRQNHLETFLTVHDLIPLLHSDPCKAGRFVTSSEKAIHGLTPESWVICISQATKDDLCSYSKAVDPSKVFVIQWAASDLFYPCHDLQRRKDLQQRYGIPDAPYILSLSHLASRKNVEHTIRCFVDLIQQEKLSDLHLVLFGAKGWNHAKIAAEISDDLTLKDKITVIGFIADEDLAPLYSNALAFVYPSLYEGFGLPPLEAMQCGTPVITSNTSSLPEVVGNAGITLNPNDTDGLCHSLLALYNQPSLRQTMMHKSLERAKQFSWEKCTQETIAAYKTALSS